MRIRKNRHTAKSLKQNEPRCLPMIEGLESRVLMTTDVSVAFVNKLKGFEQTGESTVVANFSLVDIPAFGFISGVSFQSGGSASGASITLPDSTVDEMTYHAALNQWETPIQAFNSESAMSTAFPTGSYELTVDATHDGTKTFNLTVPADDFPSTP